MKTIMYAWAITFGLAQLVETDDSSATQQTYTLIESNARLPDDPTTVFVDGASLLECSFHCLRSSSNCNGFNYNAKTLECKLMQQSNVDKSVLQSMSDFSFYQRAIPNSCLNGGNAVTLDDQDSPRPCSCVPGYRGTYCAIDCTECRVFNGYALDGFDLDRLENVTNTEQCLDACRKRDECFGFEHLYLKTEKKADCYLKKIPYLDDHFAANVAPIDESNVLHYMCAFNCRKP